MWEGQEVIVVNSEPIVSRQTHVLYPWCSQEDGTWSHQSHVRESFQTMSKRSSGQRNIRPIFPLQRPHRWNSLPQIRQKQNRIHQFCRIPICVRTHDQRISAIKSRYSFRDLRCEWYGRCKIRRTAQNSKIGLIQLFSYNIEELNKMFVETKFLEFVGVNQLNYYFGAEHRKI